MIDEMRKLTKWEKSASKSGVKMLHILMLTWEKRCVFLAGNFEWNFSRVEHLQNSRAMNFVTGWMNPAQIQRNVVVEMPPKNTKKPNGNKRLDYQTTFQCCPYGTSPPHLFCIKKGRAQQQYRCHHHISMLSFVPHIFFSYERMARFIHT